jgi:hypothetical protein
LRQTIGMRQQTSETKVVDEWDKKLDKRDK